MAHYKSQHNNSLTFFFRYKWNRILGNEIKCVFGLQKRS